MTLEEAVNKANQGDLDAILALGKYFFLDKNTPQEEKDIDKAIEWYEKGAKFGYRLLF